VPRGGKWKTGASADRAGYMAAYRLGVNKGNRELGGGAAKVDASALGAGSKTPKDLFAAAETQANPAVGSSRLYGKEVGRQTAPGKDGAPVERPDIALPGIRDLVGDDTGAALKSEGMGGGTSTGAFGPGFGRKGGI
jgi:hypothetical protein